MRILHAMPTMNPAYGGPVEGVVQLARVNKAHGYDTEILCIDDPQSPWLKKIDLKIHAVGPGRLGQYRFCWPFYQWLVRHAHEYDCVVVNGIWHFNAPAAWLALRRANTPYVVFTHGMLDPWFKRSYPIKHLKKWLYWPWALYPVLRDAAAVFFTCEMERKLARESFWLYKCHEVVINYGTAGVPTPDVDCRPAFFRAHPSLAGKRIFLFLGRVDPKKGPDILIRAVADLQRKGAWDPTTMCLVMAGPADLDYARQLRHLAECEGVAASVYWTGIVLDDLKWGAFQAAEVFVLTSHQENFGITVAEALSCGTPVLITHSVNISQEIGADGAGLVEEDTLEGCIRQLRQWLGMSEDARNQMRRKARETFRTRYTSERSAADLRENFSRITRKNPPARINGGRVTGRPLAVCHVISIFSPEQGGPVVSMRNYALGQIKAGAQPTVYTLEGYPNTSAAIRLPAEIPQFVGKVDWPSPLGGSGSLRRELMGSEPADVYHLHGIWHRALFYGYQKAKLEKRPYLVEINGALDPVDLASKPWRKRFVRHWFQDQILCEASCIHVNSIREARHVRKLGFKAPLVVIPAGFNQDEFFALQRQSAEALPAWAATLGGRKKFLYLSRIHPAKGIDDLLAAWSKLASQNPDWILLIVGPGEPREIEIRKAFCRKTGIEKQCVWTNMVSDVERAWAYTNADFFVLPSHKENFGNAVQEALGYGTPVLTTRATPWLELEQWQCGWVCDDNVASLTASLAQALKTPAEKLRQMGAAGKKIILDKYSLNRVAEQQIATYKWLMGGPPPACLWAG